PVLLGAIFNAVNPDVYAFRETGAAAKKRYIEKDLQDWAREAGLVIRFPNKVFPLRSVKVMRGCVLLQTQGRLAEFAAEAFRSYWSDEQDLADDAMLAGLCQRLRIDPEWFLDGVERPEVKAALRANTDELIARG